MISKDNIEPLIEFGTLLVYGVIDAD